MRPSPARSVLPGYLALFSSLGTLVCCALPSLLVLLGLGATVAALLAAAPWLVVLSHYKQWVFGISGLLIASNLLYLYRLAPAMSALNACSADGGACERASSISRAVLWLSAVLYLAGAFAAFGLGPILARLSE